jgi:hypothetical protein
MRQTKNSYSGQFNISLKQLKQWTNTLIHYVFITRHNEQWSKPVIIRQDYLLIHLQKDKIGFEFEYCIVS